MPPNLRPAYAPDSGGDNYDISTYLGDPRDANQSVPIELLSIADDQDLICSDCIIQLQSGLLPPPHCAHKQTLVRRTPRFVGPADMLSPLVQAPAAILRATLESKGHDPKSVTHEDEQQARVNLNEGILRSALRLADKLEMVPTQVRLKNPVDDRVAYVTQIGPMKIVLRYLAGSTNA